MLTQKLLGIKTRLLFTRFVSCKSCGIELQNKNPNEQGYYTEPKKEPLIRSPNLQDVKYLLFTQNPRNVSHENSIPTDSEVRNKLQILNCKRCCDALHRNHYIKEEFPRYSLKQVSNSIPEKSTVFHVVPLTDFPLHLDKSVITDEQFETSLLLTKGDQITPNKSLLQRKAPLFFKEFCKLYLGINSNKTVALSALSSWNVQSVYSMLAASSYLVGAPNVGKSTLINALLQKYSGRKLKNEKSFGNANSTSELEALIDSKRFLHLQTAGVSHIPNMTRAVQPYKIGEKVLYDLPGYSKNMNSIDLDSFIDKKLLERIRKTDLFKKKKLAKQSYASIKGSDSGRCYTVSGLFYLIPPPGTINQVVNYIPGEEKQYRNIDKALTVIKETYQNSETAPLKKYVGVSEEMSSKEKYVRHVIPPFQGTIEIALKDIGFFQLRCTGKYSFKGLYEIWVPKGIEVCVREPLSRLIEEGFEKSIITKRHSVACPKDRSVFSSTYPMAFDEQDVLSKMREMFLQRTSGHILSRRSVQNDPMDILNKLHQEPPNLYWFYCW